MSKEELSILDFSARPFSKNDIKVDKERKVALRTSWWRGGVQVPGYTALFPGWCLLTTQLLLPCWCSWLKPSFNFCWMQTTNSLPHPPSSLLIQWPTPILWPTSSHTQLAPWKAYWSLSQHPNPWDLRVSGESEATATLYTQCCPSVASALLPPEPLSSSELTHLSTSLSSLPHCLSSFLQSSEAYRGRLSTVSYPP